MEKRYITNNKNINLIKIILFIFPLLCGLLPLWSNFLLAIICIIGIVAKIIKNKKLILPKGYKIVLLCIYFFSFAIVEFYAIDKGMNLLGFFKNIPILLYIILYMQYDYNEEEKKEIMNVVTYAGAFSVIVSLLVMLIGNDIMYSNNRLQGMFFYANTYGMFLLLGIVLALTKEKIAKKDIIVLVILFLGIVLTNSRAIIILAAFFMLFMCFINKKNSKKIITLLGVYMLIFISLYTFSNIDKRLNNEMLGSSEFITRFLYYSDAIEMIEENPFRIWI